MLHNIKFWKVVNTTNLLKINYLLSLFASILGKQQEFRRTLKESKKGNFCHNFVANKLSYNNLRDLTLFRMGGRGQKSPHTSFSPVTSTNVRFGPQNFLTFNFNPFATLVQNFKFVPSASPKLLNLNQDHPSKKAIFLVKSL